MFDPQIDQLQPALVLTHHWPDEDQPPKLSPREMRQQIKRQLSHLNGPRLQALLSVTTALTILQTRAQAPANPQSPITNDRRSQ